MLLHYFNYQIVWEIPRKKGSSVKSFNMSTLAILDENNKVLFLKEDYEKEKKKPIEDDIQERYPQMAEDKRKSKIQRVFKTNCDNHVINLLENNLRKTGKCKIEYSRNPIQTKTSTGVAVKILESIQVKLLDKSSVYFDTDKLRKWMEWCKKKINEKR